MSKNTLKDSVTKITSEVETFFKENSIKDVQQKIEKAITEKTQGINQELYKDIDLVKKKFQEEKANLEALVQNTISAEISKAKKFLDEQKKELNTLQAKLEKLVNSKKQVAKKAVKKVASKVAKAKNAVKQKASAKKVTKKVAATKATVKKVAKKVTKKK